MEESKDAILVVKNLKKYFETVSGTVKAVDGVSFYVKKGETLGLIGESGSGKTTTGYVIMGIYAPTSGEIYFKGKPLPAKAEDRPKKLKKEIRIVPQDPGGSLNPRRNVEQILQLPLSLHGNVRKEDYREKILELMHLVGLSDDYLHRYPRTLGGRERQILAIARAIATNPSFVVLDEPTSALDVSVQGTIINLLMKMQNELGLTYLFITHDLLIMRNVASRIIIMYAGKLCESGYTKEFFENPLHPYTRLLLSSVPVLTKEEEECKPEKIPMVGEIPNPVNLPTGCYFHPRCPYAMDKCFKQDPDEMVEVKKGHFVRCWLFQK